MNRDVRVRNLAEIMNRHDRFPMPFKSLRTLSGGSGGAYLVAAMFTASYREKADRLAASCEKFGLSYVMHEVPTVHSSISSRGTDDLAYTKANFIRHVLAAHETSVLYLDADCEFTARPVLIDGLADSACDFAIYNGFADEQTDRFVPVEISLSPGEPAVKNRFYRFSGGARWRSATQLVCSGCTQFYRNSFAARALLARWHRTIAAFPGCGDDPCMDFAFNNLGRRSWVRWSLKTQWLPKSYARYAWWIHVQPVINHPDFPAASKFIPLKDPAGRSRFYRSLMEPRNPCSLFPRDCIVDTQRRVLCRLIDGQLVDVEPLSQEFWL